MKKMINKKYLSSLTVVGFLLLLSNKAYAACQNGQIPSAFDPNCSAAKPLSIGDIVSRFLPIIPVAIGLVLFGVLLWGGFQVFMSGPNDDQKKKGFQTIQNAITGVIILVFSVGIITLLETILGVKLLFGIFVS